MVNSEIVLDGRRKTESKDIYAKTLADGSKNRVALLAVNKEIHAEAVQILYSHTLKVENTTCLLDFLGQLQHAVRPRITKVWIKQYVKTTCRNAMHFLAESPNVSALHIENAISIENNPLKAARNFYMDAYKFLEAVGATRGDKAAGVDILTFGKAALQSKDEKKALKPYEDENVEAFRKALKEKLK